MSALREVLEDQQTEDDMAAELVKAAAIGGWAAYHTHDARRSPEGFPDWVFLRGGELLVWELKTVRGKTTPAQDAWLAGFAAFFDAHGIGPEYAEARVVRPSDIAECLVRLASRPGLRAEVA